MKTEKDENKSNKSNKNDRVKVFLAISLLSIISVLALPSIVFAAISCPSCQVKDCTCIVGACSSGIFSVYSNSGCAGDPVFEFTFGTRTVPWAPDTAKKYYAQAYCDDGVTKEACKEIPVNTAGGTKTCEDDSLFSTNDCKNKCTQDEECSSTTSSSGLSCYICKRKTSGGGGAGGEGIGGLNTTWLIVAILVVVGVIGFLIYRLFFSGNKRSGVTYEELYRKWAGR